MMRDGDGARRVRMQDPASDFHFIECADAEDGVAKIVQIVRDRIPARYSLVPIRDVQVLCPMNRGGLGARSLNIDLQKALNPPGEPRVERFGSTYGVGDKVMQVENDYDKEVYNGDLGVVRSIDPEASEMIIAFDGRPVTYGFGELDEVVLAYATTIHKSQGSEYPAVVIPLTTQHYPMLQRNLLDTAVTRGKRLVVIVGQKKALAIAVQGKQTRRYKVASNSRSSIVKLPAGCSTGILTMVSLWFSSPARNQKWRRVDRALAIQDIRSPTDFRLRSRQEKSGRVIVNALDGMSRSAAASLPGIVRQARRDTVWLNRNGGGRSAGVTPAWSRFLH
jgi:ATP-dependent DNA helicase RecD-like protein/UvrD-like helicase family protein